MPHYVHKHYDTLSIIASHNNIITPALVTEALGMLSNKKSPGPDGFRPEMLEIRHLPGNFINTLYVIYKSALTLGYTPRLWKESKLVFIPKPGRDKYDKPSDYRPIALSNYLLKGLERLCSCLLYTSDAADE